jgi:hypothetical protein
MENFDVSMHIGQFGVPKHIALLSLRKNNRSEQSVVISSCKITSLNPSPITNVTTNQSSHPIGPKGHEIQ